MRSSYTMGRISRHSLKTVALGAVALVVAVLLQVLVAALPARVTKFDVTGIGMTEISEETETLLASIKQDVTVYWFCPAGSSDPQLSLFLERYADAGDHVTIRVVDPAVDTDIVRTYESLGLSSHDIVVAGPARSRLIEVESLYYAVNDFVTEMNNGTEVRMTLSELEEFYSLADTYAQYGVDISAYKTRIFFDGEARLTAAIDYASRESVPHGYLLSGDGFAAPTDTVLRGLAALELTPTPLDLSTVTAIPADAGCLILYAPTRDISGDQAAMIHAYLNGGGSILMVTSPASVESCPNIMGLGKNYGLSGLPGLVVAPTSDKADATTTDVLSFEVDADAELVAQMAESHAILTVPKDGIVSSPLFTTNDKATRVDEADRTVVLGKAGKYTVASMVSRNIPTSEGVNRISRFMWFGSTAAFNDTWITRSDGSNLYCLASMLSMTSPTYESPYEVLGADDLSGDALTGYTKNTVIAIGVLLVAVLPVGLLAIGGVTVWQRRRKR